MTFRAKFWLWMIALLALFWLNIALWGTGAV